MLTDGDWWLMVVSGCIVMVKKQQLCLAMVWPSDPWATGKSVSNGPGLITVGWSLDSGTGEWWLNMILQLSYTIVVGNAWTAGHHMIHTACPQNHGWPAISTQPSIHVSGIDRQKPLGHPAMMWTATFNSDSPIVNEWWSMQTWWGLWRMEFLRAKR